MSVSAQLSPVAARLVVGAASRATGLPASGGQAIDSLAERFADQSRRLPDATAAATERAWKTLELTLAGDTLWGKLTTRAEDQSLAQEPRAAYIAVDCDGSRGGKAESFGAALRELRAAREAPTFAGGTLRADEVRRHYRAVTNYADPAALLDAEWQSAAWVGEEFDVLGYKNLAAFLRLRAGELPFLAVAVRYYFRRAVEGDRELFQGLAFAKLEATSSAQRTPRPARTWSWTTSRAARSKATSRPTARCRSKTASRWRSCSPTA